jgi:hypothetical protein
MARGKAIREAWRMKSRAWDGGNGGVHVNGAIYSSATGRPGLVVHTLFRSLL